MPKQNREVQRVTTLIDELQQLLKVLQRCLSIAESMAGVNAAAIDTGVASIGSIPCEKSTNAGGSQQLQETPITFDQARKFVPSNPPPSSSTLSRWCTTGCRGIKLESYFIGGRRKTTRQAVLRFLAACRASNWSGIHPATVVQLEQAMSTRLGQDANEGE